MFVTWQHSPSPCTQLGSRRRFPFGDAETLLSLFWCIIVIILMLKNYRYSAKTMSTSPWQQFPPGRLPWQNLKQAYSVPRSQAQAPSPDYNHEIWSWSRLRWLLTYNQHIINNIDMKTFLFRRTNASTEVMIMIMFIMVINIWSWYLMMMDASWLRRTKASAEVTPSIRS